MRSITGGLGTFARHVTVIHTDSTADEYGLQWAEVLNLLKCRESLFSTGVEVAILGSARVTAGASQNSPNHSERERRVNMDEKRRDLVLVVEHKTIPPCNHRTG
jgi:hypothetical protein